MITYRKYLSASIYRLNKLFKLRLQDAISEVDITPDQWIVLGQIYRNSGKINQREIAENCFKERAAVTRILDILQRKGYVERRASETDRRQFLIAITDKGKEIYEESYALIKAMKEDIDSHLTKDELEQLLHLLGKLEKTME